jgi:hypothetical protein
MGSHAWLLNGFNRLVVIILAWSLLGIAALYARDPASTIALVQGYLDPWRYASQSALVGAIAVSGLAFLLLLVEIWPGGRRNVFEVPIEGGIVEYEARVLVAAITQELATLDGAQVSAVDVAGGGSKVRLRVRLSSTRDGDPSAIAGLVSNRARDTVKQLGLELQSIRLNMASDRVTGPIAVRHQAQPVA